MVFPIVGGNESKSAAQQNSLRFNDGDSASLNITLSGSGTQGTYTFSAWIKRSVIGGSYMYLFSHRSSDDGNAYGLAFHTSNNTLYVYAGSGVPETAAQFRDPAAWYHIVLSVNSTSYTLYVNGTSIKTGTAESLVYGKPFNVGNYNYSSGSNYFDGYMADVHFIDGTAKAATDFGETNSNGVWIPKDYDGSYGTNGFRLEFQQTGTSQNATGIGADTSGQGNHLAVTNLAATDVTTDSPTNNFATLNPLNAPPNKATFSEGNLKSVTPTTGNQGGLATQGVSTGKWYAEFRYTAKSSDRRINVGQVRDLSPINSSNTVIGDNTTDIGYRSVDGKIWYNSGLSTYGNTYDVGDIIGVALDLDNGYIYFSKNNTWQNSGNPTSGSSGTGGISNSISIGENHFIGFSDATGDKSETMTANYGQDSSFAGQETRQNNSDGNSFGDFYYSPPSGYYALCTKNLAEFG